MSEPDFEALRAERNASVMAQLKRFAEENDVSLGQLQCNFNPNACYCACTSGGPCEHKWDGEPYTSEDDRIWSATCSRCGSTAMSHDMRVLP